MIRQIIVIFQIIDKTFSSFVFMKKQIMEYFIFIYYSWF